MRRAVRIGSALASALACAAAAAVWVSTVAVDVRLDYTWIDRRHPTWRATGPYLMTTPHQVTVGLQRIDYAPRHAFVPIESVAPPGLSWQQTTPPPAAAADLPGRLGFAWVDPPARLNTGYGDVRVAAAVVPLWFVVALTAAWPAWVLWRFAGRVRRPPTACRACGYDLRATPGRCPECGATPARPSRSR